MLEEFHIWIEEDGGVIFGCLTEIPVLLHDPPNSRIAIKVQKKAYISVINAWHDRTYYRDTIRVSPITVELLPRVKGKEPIVTFLLGGEEPEMVKHES